MFLISPLKELLCDRRRGLLRAIHGRTVSSMFRSIVMSSASIDKRIGYVFDSLMEAHRGGMGHPERPSRIRSIHQRLGERGLLERVKNVAGRPATDEELFLVHPQVHVDRVMQFEEEGVLKSALDGGEDSEGPYNPSTEDEGEEN
ncbi:Histone deacetylase domain, partial [Perkinsus olseni]